MYQRGSNGEGSGVTYTGYSYTTQNIYSLSQHKWTYTFDPTKLYGVKLSAYNGTGYYDFIMQNGKRTMLREKASSNMTISWSGNTITVTVNANGSYGMAIFEE